jgi:hypothetical protein
MSEIRPIFKLVGYPFLFIYWSLYRVIHVTYVDSPSFMEFWEEL